MPIVSDLSLTRADPKGLIRESFRMEGLELWECRSIFVDWALSLPDDVDPIAAIRLVIDSYAPKASGGGQGAAHPMVAVLLEGLQGHSQAPGRRRGGRAARVKDDPAA